MLENQSIRLQPNPTEVPMRLSKMNPDFKRIIGVQLREFIHEIDDLVDGAYGICSDSIELFENNAGMSLAKVKRAS